jgi:hypothetical protein
MSGNTFSSITLVCAVAYQFFFSIATSFAEQPKIPPRCYMRYYNCLADYNSKDPAIAAQCKDQYNNCLKGKGGTIR